jgi:hypothetical protein
VAYHVVALSNELELPGGLLGVLLLRLGLLSLTCVHLLKGLLAGCLVRPLSVVHLLSESSSGSKRIAYSVSDLQELLVNFIESSSDTGRESCNDGLLDDTRSDGLDKLVQKIVLAVSDLEGQSVKLDGNIFGLQVSDILPAEFLRNKSTHPEDLVTTVHNRFDLDGDRDTLSCERNVGNTAVISSSYV